MGQKYTKLSNKLIEFINSQHMFFVGTADIDGRVSISPKGLDSLKILNEKQLVWLNLTGSGNETAAHIQHYPRMTMMFTSFVGMPLVLRVYGSAKVFHKNDAEWEEFSPLFQNYTGARQFFVLDIDMVQTSCGTGVPYYDFKGEREQLINSFERRGEEGTKKYWADKNQLSIDGKATHILQKNT